MPKQELQQKQGLTQKISKKQIQLMNMLEMDSLSFMHSLEKEIEENPVLELNDREDDLEIDKYLEDDTPRYKYKINNNRDSDNKQLPYISKESFIEGLKKQIHTFKIDDQTRLIADFLIGNIGSNGYIRRDLLDIIDDIEFSENIVLTEKKIREVLKLVQQLDPPGVGATSLRECLLIQLKRKNRNDSIDLAIALLEKHYDAFVKKHYDKILDRENISKEDLKNSISEIEKLNPKPSGEYASDMDFNEDITPDFIIDIEDNNIEVKLNMKYPELIISPSYIDVLQTYKETGSKKYTKAAQFIKHKLNTAKHFIDNIKQRQQTLMKVMNTIVEYQKDYLLTGDYSHLKPMRQKDIADEIGMNISTVSRVVRSKYAMTPYGIILLSRFFTDGIKNTEGKDISVKQVKDILSNIIDQEDKKKPITDDKLALLLKEKGINIARRTIAKYREQLEIPIARLRKTI
ncbi:RNA polymerase factor sigma-54 [Ichthyobacterium seriolicida]|uniref:RNA polymerase sigma-54 factor RpoN n=1 Tax=Ichthyobacterium seriolicida TaxID=242600 RepID=A0A1J1E6B2_9FLAO|nr:RNA polymerase factor sigma-54 [Ichthyobacterium seriolicida]BAV94862.1 RNA polymerase sigma-54 factor RpoN [Ichthyobacterium seriolicida]